MTGRMVSREAQDLPDEIVRDDQRIESVIVSRRSDQAA
jgi:hypothetical protein